MTVTIKLDSGLEEQLRQRAQASGRTTSDVVRAALQAYLARPEEGQALSAFELGADLFGRHAGTSDLATARKALFAEAVAQRRVQGPGGG